MVSWTTLLYWRPVANRILWEINELQRARQFHAPFSSSHLKLSFKYGELTYYTTHTWRSKRRCDVLRDNCQRTRSPGGRVGVWRVTESTARHGHAPSQRSSAAPVCPSPALPPLGISQVRRFSGKAVESTTSMLCLYVHCNDLNSAQS